ncbi:hypothetical protein KC331_g8560 [Hortaea werneckii]|nr:hypothetical protein KC331_g8560 [Hortaea werneckii]
MGSHRESHTILLTKPTFTAAATSSLPIIQPIHQRNLDQRTGKLQRQSETVSFHLPIRTLLGLRLPDWTRSLVPYYPHPALISTALLLSSFTKLFPLLLLVWQYDLPSSASAVSWAVIINNVAALEILLGCGYMRATVLCGVGAVGRAAVGWMILRAVGIGGGVAAAGVVETGDLIEVWRRLTGALGFG